jgi:hypothetical protein
MRLDGTKARIHIMMRSIRNHAVLLMSFATVFHAASASAQEPVAIISPDTQAGSTPTGAQASTEASAPTQDACTVCAATMASQRPLKHVLNGHAFLPSVFIPNEFVDTRTSLAIGVGYGNYNSSVLNTLTNVKLGAFSPAVDVQVLLVDWLAIDLGMTGNAVAGLNASSVLQYGGSVAYTWRFGLIGQIWNDRSSNLALALEVDRPHLLAVSPLESAVQSVQEYLGNSTPDFPTNGVETQYKPSLRYAYGFSPVIGLRGFAGFNFQTGQDLAQRRTGNQFNFGIGLSSDLKPWVDVPIGITANYRRNQIISGGAVNADIFEFGIFETVSNRFNFGGEAGFTNTNKVDTKIFSLIARGYFN